VSSSTETPSKFVYKEIQTTTFKIAVWEKITNPKSTVRFYIEGDGFAFNASGQPSFNPTPRSDLVRSWAFGDPNDNVIYLARPCQYVKDPKCEYKYWSDARFSPEVIDSMEQVVKMYSRKPVVLIGYSGGAQITGQILMRHQVPVKRLTTVAAVFDHKSWTAFHKDRSLHESRNLALLRNVPQMHYAGEKDKVVPPALIMEFVQNKHLVTVVPGATHGKGWDSILTKMYLAN